MLRESCVGHDSFMRVSVSVSVSVSGSVSGSVCAGYDSLTWVT